jgi:O-antigen ligase
MATMLCVIGVQFVRSDWRGRLFCFVVGGFTANAVILTRSRGAVVGLAAGGLAALVTAPREYRKYIFVGLLLGGAGFLVLTDEQWHSRTSTILADEEERDSSAEARIVLARAGVQMWMDHPLGVGAGTFYQFIGNYLPDKAGKDAHNTYIRCLTELGIQGLGVLGLIILSGFLTLRRIGRRAEALPPEQRRDVRILAFGLRCALATMCACCLTISLTYVEFLWWFLMLPVCLERVVSNMEADARAEVHGGEIADYDEAEEVAVGAGV